MSKIFGWLKGYNNFSRGDRNAILILCVLILITVFAKIIVNNIEPKSKYNHLEYVPLLNEMDASKNNYKESGKSLFAFDPNSVNPEKLDSLDIPEFIKRNIVNYRKAGGRFSSLQDVRKIYGMNDSIYSLVEKYIIFSEETDRKTSISISENRINGFVDPNLAGFDQLIEFGFNRFQANNIIEYRNSGGVFKTQSDLLKIYGIDSAFFNLIENHIRIENIKESPVANYSNVVIRIELNSADSTELMKLDGIGSVYAARILKYRDLLGGYYSVSQLLEVYNFPEETFKKIENSIFADTLLVKKIRINFAEYADLLRHPYLSKKQVEAVLNYRDKNGPIQNILQLKTNGLVDPETFSRIRPYFTCR